MRSKNFIIPVVCLLFAFCLEMPLFSSNKMNVDVVQGDVSLVQQQKTTKIHASDCSLIQMDHFGVSEKEDVKIIQPSQDAVLVILDRSGQPTRIKNKLSANGTVYLFNPQGIYIDKEALVEKGNFYFIGSEMKGMDVAAALQAIVTTGDVVNHGVIDTIGSVYLMGRHVVNSGSIRASEKIVIAKTQAKEQLSVLHTGLMQSKDIFIEAREGTCEIYGKIDAKNAIENQYGGKICVLGQHVRLIGAYIDASGTFKGGNVNLGGGFEGKGDLFKATRTSVDDKSIVDASAIEYGEGGQVVLWSEELTSFQGEIFARGGRKYGSGGLVETSSANHLGIFSGKVNVDAACGEPGQWMLDPSSIVISDVEYASENFADVIEYPPQSGSQVTISVKALNNFSGGKLQLAATNRITIDANIENISSTLELTLRAGNQIRFKNEYINIPNGKISFIVDNKESGQIICSKNFKGITAHQMEMIAPKGAGNGFQVETNSLVLTMTDSSRSQSSFVFNTDVYATNNHQHQLYLKRAPNQVGTVLFQGALEGFDFVNTETNLTVKGAAQVAHLVTKGPTKINLLGGGEISEMAELESMGGIALAGTKSSPLKIHGNVNTTCGITSLQGPIEIGGEFEAGEVKLLGNTSINTNNNPFIVHQNIAQDKKLANLTIRSGTAQTTIEGSVYANDFAIQSSVAPILCGEVCVHNLSSTTPSLTLAHDLVVSGRMQCQNLTTNGENKKVAFAQGGVFKGQTQFNHTGTTTLGDTSGASFHFDQMLDTHLGDTFTHGLIYVNGPVEMHHLYLTGDTSVQCEHYSCHINGSIEEQNAQAHLNINTKSHEIALNEFVKVSGLSLQTTQPLQIEVPVTVSHFQTTAPNVVFKNHLYVGETFTTNNVIVEGDTTHLTLLGQAMIHGSAQFDNKGQIKLGQNPESIFKIDNHFSCQNCAINIQGQFDVIGQIDFLEVILEGNTQLQTHGHTLNVSQAVFCGAQASDLSVNTDNGDINFGSKVHVRNLKLETKSPIYVQSQVEVNNFSTTSPLVTFANDTLIFEEVHGNSIAAIGKEKTFQLNKGGRLLGDGKFANSGDLILGRSADDLLELNGAFDRSHGKTIAQGTVRTHNGLIDLDELSLSGPLSILSVSNDGTGADITFHSSVDGAHMLTVNAASGRVFMERAFGAQQALTGLVIYANKMMTKSDMFITQGATELYTNIHLANNLTIESDSREGIIFYGHVDGNYDLNANSAHLIVLKKDIGFKEMLNTAHFAARRIDVWSSISVNSGAINFDGDVEICENIKMIDSGRAGISFNGKVDGDYYCELRVNDPKGRIQFHDDVGMHMPIRQMVLVTSTPMNFSKRIFVDHFETTSPLATFYSDVTIAGAFHAHHVSFDGARQNVNLMGDSTILGHVTFNNKGDLYLGSDDDIEFVCHGTLLRNDGPTYARGTITAMGNTADFEALYAVGQLTLKSDHGTVFNFNSTIDGSHQVHIVSKTGSVTFQDYVGHHHPLAGLHVQAPTIAMQRQITVRDHDLILDGNLRLMNHSSLQNLNGEKVAVTGQINGEWDLNILAPSDSACVTLLGSIGNEKPLNRLNIDIQNEVQFENNVTTYNLSSTAPIIIFNNDVEIKQQFDAYNVVMAATQGHYSVFGNTYLKGSLELNNTQGTTLIGESRFSTVTTEGSMGVHSKQAYVQGVLQTKGTLAQFDKLYLNGPLSIRTTAEKAQGADIQFSQEIVGGYALEIDAGQGMVSIAKVVGSEMPVHSFSVQAAAIQLASDIHTMEGATDIHGALTLVQNVAITDRGAGGISFFGPVNGAYTLEVVNEHAKGQVSFSQRVGEIQPLEGLLITSNNQVEFPMSLEVSTLTSSAPMLILADEVTVRGNIKAHHLLTKGKYRSVRFLGSGQFTGMTTFENSGTLVLGNSADSTFDFSGPLAVESCVLITQSKIISRGAVSLKELSLKGHTSFDTQGHAFKVKGLVEQIMDQSALSLETGAGQISFGSTVNAGHLTVNTSLPVEFHNPVNVMALSTKSPHVLFANDVTIVGEIHANNITTTGNDYKVRLLGGGEIKGNTSFKNGRGLILGGHDQAVITFHGPLDTTSSLLETRGTIETVSKTIDIGTMCVVGNTTIRSTSKNSDGQDIYFLGAIEGPKQLRANAGKAKVCFENHVGAKVALESLQATGTKIELDGDVNSHNGNVVFAGDVVFTNTSNLTAHGKANIIFQGTVNVDENAKGPVDLILDTTGKIEFQKDVGSEKAFNEVVVTHAGELICRSPLKSNVIQTQGKSVAKVDKKTTKKKELESTEEAQKISKTQVEEHVHKS